MSSQQLETVDSDPEQLSSSVEEAVLALRASLLAAYAEVGADPSAPQDVSRQFGVTKSQAWKIAKVIGATDPLEAARYLPGRRGLDRLLSALTGHGLSRGSADDVLRAMESFHAVVSTHAGDRATFARTLESMRAESSDPAAMESSRKLSFLGNSGTWGIQARARISVRMVVPDADDPDFLDIANVSGLLDLRRLRSKGRWPVAQYSTTRAQGEMPHGPVPLEGEDGEAPFLTDFCTSPLPPIRRVDVGNGLRFDLPDGPVGKAAALSCVFGLRFRRFAPVHASSPDGTAEHATLLRTPAEVAVIDLLVHRALPFELPPTARLYSQMETGALTADPTARLRLPLAEPVERLGSGPPLMATPHVARHAELVEHDAALMDCSLDDFSAFRLVLRYPPIPTMVSLGHPLIPR